MSIDKIAAFYVEGSDLRKLSEKQIRKTFGGKALGLYQALLLDIKVPQTFFLPIEHYEAFLASSASKEGNFKEAAVHWILDHFATDLALLPDTVYAVRSSSQYEDAFEHSYAGIFESILDVKKTFLPEAIAAVWESCFSLRVRSYVEVHADVRMGVLLQPMLQAKFSGVAFSRHPSPSDVHENQNIVIEFAPLSGDQIVQGKVTPYRLSGTLDSLLASQESKWMVSLLDAMLLLKTHYKHEVDIEFVIDKTENFWLVQQRPISILQTSHTLDLAAYTRKYKRALFSLDCELLIEGCALYLASYLEIPYQMEKWMVMTTGADSIQELWVHGLLDRAVVNKICQKIEEDGEYVERLKQRYALYFQKILTQEYALFFNKEISLQKRFFAFCEFILPLQAHYYVPMFLIDALHTLLVHAMKKIDPEHAEEELFKMGTWKIASLMEQFYEQLREIKSTSHHPFSFEDEQKIKELWEKYDFLKCRALVEPGYTLKEIYTLLEYPPERTQGDPLNYDDLKRKYLVTVELNHLFSHFREWMRIRNQEMEYLMFALYRSRPLFEEISTHFSTDIKVLWNSSKEVIMSALDKDEASILDPFSNKDLAIYRNYGKTRVRSGLKILKQSKDHASLLKGKTVYGKGRMRAKVQIAFSIKQLELHKAEENTILVTGMTTPDFIPYLKRHFCALITDEGGILCHAAIVAREIPIPCIVGTGMATEMLIENSWITIDFDKAEINLSI